MATINISTLTTIEAIQAFVNKYDKITDQVIADIKQTLDNEAYVDMLITQLEYYIDQRDAYAEAVIVKHSGRTTVDEDGLSIPLTRETPPNVREFDGLELTQAEYDEYFETLMKVEQLYYGLMD